GGAFLSSMLVESRMRAGVPVLRWEVAPEFSEMPEEHRFRAAREWCERNLDPALRALENLISCFGEDFGPQRRPARCAADAERAQSGAPRAFRGRAQARAVSPAGTASVPYRGPAAAAHRGRARRTRQRAVSRRDRAPALRRAHRAGDALGAVVPR